MSDKWEKQEAMGGAHHVMRGDGFHVSFNPNPGERMKVLEASPAYQFLKSLAEAKDMRTLRNDTPETALVRGNGMDAEYRILIGDWREQYEALIPQGWDACLAFFESHRPLHGSAWTSHRLYPNDSVAEH